MNVTINNFDGTQIWEGTFNNCFVDGEFNVELGTAELLEITPDVIYQMVVAIDIDSETFISAHVIFGDDEPVGDMIEFRL